MKVAENNTLKKEIKEILKLCDEAKEEYGEKASYFNEGASESEIEAWESKNGIKIPESYKDWLKFSADCQIRDTLASFFFPRLVNIVPEDLVLIGNLIGDGEVLCFSKTTGKFVRYFEGQVNDEMDTFKEMLKEIIRMMKGDSGISEEAEKLFMQFMKNAEERKRKREGDN